MSLLVSKDALPRSAARAFEVWNRRGIRWCLLRPIENDASVRGDIDILLHPDDEEAAHAILAAFGYSQLKSYGRGSHRFFLSYSSEDQNWTQLDTVTELAYGSHTEFRLLSAAALLTHRQSVDGTVYALQPNDTCWAVLLHCILDKGYFSPKYVGLFESFETLPADGAIAETITTSLKPTQLALLAKLFASNDFDGILELAPSLRAQLEESSGLDLRWRKSVGTTGRLFERALQAPRRRGPTVALLGPDGAGKSSLSAAVARNYFFNSEEVYFGLWKATHKTRIGAALAVARRPLTALKIYIKGQIASFNGRLVVFDRYTYDARIDPKPPFRKLKKLYMAIIARACPQPDLVVVLDAPGDVMFQRKGEKNIADLEKSRAQFAAIASRINRPVLTVDATCAPEVIANQTIEFIWDFQARRLDPKRSAS